MKINDPNIPRVPSVATFDESPSGAYKTQHYYKQEIADQLAQAVAKYVTEGRVSLAFPFAAFGGKPATLKLLLNCGRAYIMDHPESYDHDIVDTLLHGGFYKRGEEYRFVETERARGIGQGSRTTTNLSSLAVVTTSEGDEVRPVDEPENTAGPGIVNAPAKSMAYLPDDGDIETLLINLQTFASTAMSRQLFERREVKLSPGEIERIKSTATGLKLVGYARPTEVKYAKP